MLALKLAIPFKQSNAADLNKETLAMQIDEENKKDSQPATPGSQVTQTNQSGHNFNVSGSGNTISTGNTDNSRHNSPNIHVGGGITAGNLSTSMGLSQ